MNTNICTSCLGVNDRWLTQLLTLQANWFFFWKQIQKIAGVENWLISMFEFYLWWWGLNLWSHSKIMIQPWFWFCGRRIFFVCWKVGVLVSNMRYLPCGLFAQWASSPKHRFFSLFSAKSMSPAYSQRELDSHVKKAIKTHRNQIIASLTWVFQGALFFDRALFALFRLGALPRAIHIVSLRILEPNSDRARR